MKLWVDDERPVPDDSWTLAMTTEEAKDALLAASSSDYEEIERVSLDYTLKGWDTGQDVLEWMIEQKITPRRLTVHSSSFGGRQLLIEIAQEAGIEATVYVPGEDS